MKILKCPKTILLHTTETNATVMLEGHLEADRRRLAARRRLRRKLIDSRIVLTEPKVGNGVSQ